MKFLIFNLTVVAALGYLIMGNDKDFNLQTVESKVSKTIDQNFGSSLEKVKKAVSKPAAEIQKQLVSQNIESSIVKPLQKIKNNIETKVRINLPVQHIELDSSLDVHNVSSTNLKDMKSGAAIATSKTNTSGHPNYPNSIKKSEIFEDEQVSVKKRIVKKVNMNQKIESNKKKPNGTDTNFSSDDKKEISNNFMSIAERRRELNKLAREMELVFVDKLTM